MSPSHWSAISILKGAIRFRALPADFGQIGPNLRTSTRIRTLSSTFGHLRLLDDSERFRSSNPIPDAIIRLKTLVQFKRSSCAFRVFCLIWTLSSVLGHPLWFRRIHFCFERKTAQNLGINLSSHGNQVDNQTWFDATLVYECTRWRH